MASKLNTPNLVFGEERYLIRLDGVVVGTVDTEKEAIAALNSIASVERKKLEATGLTILYRLLRDGREIRLISQHQGHFQQTYLRPELTIDFTAASQIHYISPYADKIAQYKAKKAAVTTAQ